MYFLNQKRFNFTFQNGRNSKFASTTSSIRAYLTKQIYKQLHVSSRNVLQFTSEFTSAFKCSYKCSLSNSNFNSNIVEFRFLDSSF